MIALARPPRAFQPEPNGTFAAMLPTIRRYAEIAFRRFRTEAREDAVQEVIVNAFVAFLRLVQRNRQQVAFPTVLARYAVAQFFAGRRVGTGLNIRDVMSPHAQRRKRLVVERLDAFDPHEDTWREAVIEDTHTPVIEQVWFRIDFPEWLSSLSVRNRRIAQALAAGNSTNEVAQKFNISPGRVSQLRGELHDAWEQFHGEEELQRQAY